MHILFVNLCILILYICMYIYYYYYTYIHTNIHVHIYIYIYIHLHTHTHTHTHTYIYIYIYLHTYICIYIYIYIYIYYNHVYFGLVYYIIFDCMQKRLELETGCSITIPRFVFARIINFFTNLAIYDNVLCISSISFYINIGTH